MKKVIFKMLDCLHMAIIDKEYYFALVDIKFKVIGFANAMFLEKFVSLTFVFNLKEFVSLKFVFNLK